MTTIFDTMINLNYDSKKLALRLTLILTWRDPGYYILPLIFFTEYIAQG